MPRGPQPIGHEQRMQNALAIARQLKDHYSEQVLALGLYGSLAKNLDLPYSDIEMHCILKAEEVDFSYEWSTGPWKAEVNVISADIRLREAATVDVDWAITHGSYVQVLPLDDPTRYFEALRQAVFSPPEQVFRQVMADVIVGEIYERIGKVRNAMACGRGASLPAHAIGLAELGACLIGLDQRHLFASFASLWSESLSLPGRPGGYDALCEMATSGKLDSPPAISAAADAFWDGIEAWAAERGLVIEHQLENLLRENTSPG